MFKLYKLFVLCVGLLLLGLAPVVLAQDNNTVQGDLTEFQAVAEAGKNANTAITWLVAQTDTVTGTETATDTTETDATETATDTTETDVTTTEIETDTTETDVTTTETETDTTETTTDALTSTTTTAPPTTATTLPQTGGVASPWSSVLLLVAGAAFVLIGILSLTFARRSR